MSKCRLLPEEPNENHNGSPHGLVLAGGHSTRMGTDKSLLVYHGKPQRQFVFDLLARFCDQVFTSCRREQNVPARLNPLFDSHDIHGPINGILSAFAFKPDTSWLIVAVDMPFAGATALQLLIDQRDKNKLATCFFDPETRQPEPLLTLWEEQAYPYLLKFKEKGNISPREFLKRHAVNLILPPDEKTLVNVNYPDVSGGA